MSTQFGEVPFLMNIRVEQCWSAQWLSLHPIPLFTSLTPRAGMVTCPPLFYAAHLLPRRHHQLLLLHPLPLLLLLIGIISASSSTLRSRCSLSSPSGRHYHARDHGQDGDLLCKQLRDVVVDVAEHVGWQQDRVHELCVIPVPPTEVRSRLS